MFRKAEILKLVPYGKVTPLALPQQMLARIKLAMDEGRDVHVLACVVEKLANGSYNYRSYWSTMPAEVMLMAAHELHRRATTDD